MATCDLPGMNRRHRRQITQGSGLRDQRLPKTFTTLRRRSRREIQNGNFRQSKRTDLRFDQYRRLPLHYSHHGEVVEYWAPDSADRLARAGRRGTGGGSEDETQLSLPIAFSCSSIFG